MTQVYIWTETLNPSFQKKQDKCLMHSRYLQVCPGVISILDLFGQQVAKKKCALLEPFYCLVC
jgi:hypothetical protein